MNLRVSLIMLLLTTAFMSSYAQDDKIIELALTYNDGYGPFKNIPTPLSFYENMDSSNAVARTIPKIKQLPIGIDSLKAGLQVVNWGQYYYQTLPDINIFPKFSEYFDSTTLTKKPIHCYIAFAVGIKEGKRVVVLDKNMNMDLSDDAPIELKTYKEGENLNVLNDSIFANYQVFKDNQVENRQIKMNMMYVPSHNFYVGDFAQYATCSLDSYQIYICPDDFKSLSYSLFSVLPVLDGEEPDKNTQLYKDGQIMEILGNKYKILSVDQNKQVLKLEKLAN